MSFSCPKKEILYRNGLIRFLIPKSWREAKNTKRTVEERSTRSAKIMVTSCAGCVTVAMTFRNRERLIFSLFFRSVPRH
jgi:hypothetical protein